MLDRETKVFGIGLSRTGTVSLATALTALGIEARHYPHDPITQEELAAPAPALTGARHRVPPQMLPVRQGNRFWLKPRGSRSTTAGRPPNRSWSRPNESRGTAPVSL